LDNEGELGAEDTGEAVLEASLSGDDELEFDFLNLPAARSVRAGAGARESLAFFVGLVFLIASLLLAFLIASLLLAFLIASLLLAFLTTSLLFAFLTFCAFLVG
jgi:VIT1/CCC1 family predicted Fe2+/Mn2+ transporter